MLILATHTQFPIAPGRSDFDGLSGVKLAGHTLLWVEDPAKKACLYNALTADRAVPLVRAVDSSKNRSYRPAVGRCEVCDMRIIRHVATIGSQH